MSKDYFFIVLYITKYALQQTKIPLFLYDAQTYRLSDVNPNTSSTL